MAFYSNKALQWIGLVYYVGIVRYLYLIIFWTAPNRIKKRGGKGITRTQRWRH